MAKLSVHVLKDSDNTSSLATLKDILKSKLVIPEYQRRYAWREENIRELFDTIAETTNGVFKFDPTPGSSDKEDEQKISIPCFLGSIIFCSVSKEQKPAAEEYLIIDGQQRIVSLLVILRYALYEIREIIAKLEDNIEEVTENKNNKVMWEIQGKETEISDCLKKVSIKRRNGQEYEREGSKKEGDILAYINTEQDENSIKTIEEQIADAIDEGFNSIKRKANLDQDDTPINQAKFYIQFTSHILRNITFCWLYISGEKSEDYAIDMFNIMNSTGEPLTGFDILKSTLYKIQPVFGNRIGEIQDDLSSYLKQNRQKIIQHTGKLILLLSIYRDDYGDDVVSDKQFAKQKRYVQKICKNNGGENNTRETIYPHAAEVLESYGANNGNDTSETIYPHVADAPGAYGIDDENNTGEEICSDVEEISKFYITKWIKKKHDYNGEAGFCFNFLIDLRHDRTLPTLLRFDRQTDQINSAIKVCTAFSVIWRLLHNVSTGGVDKKYLEIYQELELSTQEPSIESLRDGLIEKLKDKITTILNVSSEDIKLSFQSKWTEILKDVPIYIKNGKLARFLILLASNRLTYQDKVLVRTGGLNLLTPENYNSSTYKTIDHIIPQKPENKDDTINNVHTLGNLTLLPLKFNAALKNADFNTKKNEFNRVIKRETDDTLPYLPTLKEIISHEEFNQETVDKRTEVLGKFLWDRLVIDWLGWKD